MTSNDQPSPSASARLVKWGVILAVAVAIAWIVSYFLGLQIYDAAVRITH